DGARDLVAGPHILWGGGFHNGIVA
ncbi:MAG: hypothetical protein RL029_1036, partial [Actinomycetota bacterium]